jgi:hypothetical protein
MARLGANPVINRLDEYWLAKPLEILKYQQHLFKYSNQRPVAIALDPLCLINFSLTLSLR